MFVSVATKTSDETNDPDVSRGHVAIAEALDCLPLGILVVDAEARVLHMNQRAAAITGAKDGLAVARGRLVADFLHESLRLRELIHETAKSGAAGETAMPISRISGGRPLLLIVAPPRRLERRLGAIVFVGDPEDEGEVLVEHLMMLFGLTRTEAALTLALLHGQGLEWASRHLAIGMNTARTHLKRIFDKTGTHRQAELVRLVLRSPATLLSS